MSEKGYIGWERRNKPNFVPKDIIIYVENPKEMANKPPRTNISLYNKAAGYKVHI